MSEMPTFDLASAADSEREEIDRSLANSRRWALIALFILVFGFGLAAAIVPIGGSVVGQGRLGAESQVKRISHAIGGVIAQIYVRDGDRVREGQVLMRLDTTVSGVSADLSSQSVDQLLAQEARLRAESEGLRGVAFAPEFAARQDESARAARAAEERLFALRATTRAGQRAQLSDRVRQLQRQITGYEAQITALQQQKKLIEPERQGVRELWDKGLVTINRLNQLERTAVDFDGQIGAMQASIGQVSAQISETNEQIITLDQQARSEAGAELARVRSTLNDQRVRSTSAGNEFDRSAIKAPWDGVVDKLAFTTIGGVVRPAETIMEVVPDKDSLIVEAAISPTDIDRVRNGQNTRVRLSAFNAQATPEIAGKVIFVSAELATDQNKGTTYYRVRIRLDPAAIKREKLDLKPGMPAEVFISTGSRSMLSYLTKPFRDQLERAFNY